MENRRSHKHLFHTVQTGMARRSKFSKNTAWKNTKEHENNVGKRFLNSFLLGVHETWNSYFAQWRKTAPGWCHTGTALNARHLWLVPTRQQQGRCVWYTGHDDPSVTIRVKGGIKSRACFLFRACRWRISCKSMEQKSYKGWLLMRGLHERKKKIKKKTTQEGKKSWNHTG